MLEVVAAFIQNNHRALLCQRPQGKNLAGKWEFPGGKIEPGETPQAALFREIVEELGAELQVGEKLADTIQTYPDRTIHLTLYSARVARGTLRRLEHSDMQWTPLGALKDFDLCPADARLVEILTQKGILQAAE